MKRSSRSFKHKPCQQLLRLNLSLLILAGILCWLAQPSVAAVIGNMPPDIEEPYLSYQQFARNNMVDLIENDSETLGVGLRTPVIGILTEVLRDYKKFVEHRHLFIASSYIKWIESAGAQVVPILLNQDDQYYERMFNQTNGLLFPGGDNLLDPSKRTPMMVAAKKLYKLATEANDRGDFYPIWGTCLGMELLSVLTANQNVLVNCSATDIPLRMEFTEDRGKLFSPKARYGNLPGLTADFSQVIRTSLTRGNLTYNFHHKCLTDKGLHQAGLTEFYQPLAYSRDVNNLEFIAIMEAKQYPFYGVQFHPEKPPFEWVFKRSQQRVPHSRQAIAVSRFFADFFVQQAEQNGHRVDRHYEGQFQRELIYAFDPMYTAPKNDMYEQRYLFPFDSNKAIANRLSSEEFLEHVPESDEEIQEEVSESGKSVTLSNVNEINSPSYIISQMVAYKSSGLADEMDDAENKENVETDDKEWKDDDDGEASSCKQLDCRDLLEDFYKNGGDTDGTEQGDDRVEHEQDEDDEDEDDEDDDDTGRRKKNDDDEAEDEVDNHKFNHRAEET